MIITTTNSIEGSPVQKYLGLVTSNLVIGTNVISDFIASFSDFFGGMSGQYRNQLNRLYERAIKDLTQKAHIKGANAVIGTRLDFDEISGKGKSMFMVSVSGTAVKCRIEIDTKHEESNGLEKSISEADLNIAQFLNRWRNTDKIKVSDEEWDFISSHDLPEIAEDLLVRRMRVYNFFDTITLHEGFDTKLSDYLNKLDPDIRLASIYAAYYKLDERTDISMEEKDAFFSNLIEQYMLFCPYQITKLLNKGRLSFATMLLKTNKPFYTREDLDEMVNHIQMFENLPDTGHIAEVERHVFSSKTTKIFVCQNGHENDINDEFCWNGSCGCNIKGLTREQIRLIEEYKEKVNILKEMYEESITAVH